MTTPSFAYLVEEVATKKRRLVTASQPANAIAFCAKGLFTAQRVEGAVLDTLTSTMTMEHVTPPKPEGGEAAGGDGDSTNNGGAAETGDQGKGKSGRGATAPKDQDQDQKPGE